MKASAKEALASDEPLKAKKPNGVIKSWILNHDDSWVFMGSYILLAVTLSIWISLFWLVAVVAVHFVFEWVVQSDIDDRPVGVLARCLWETKLDIALVILALSIGVYMEVILGAAGLSGAARLGIQGSVRFAGWQNVIRGIILSLDDAAQVARVAMKKGDNGDTEDSPFLFWGGWESKWGKGDYFTLSLGLLSIASICLAPNFTDHTYASTLQLILQDLHPWPGD